MLLLENVNGNRVMTITARGKLSKEDYEQILPELKKTLDGLDEDERLKFFVQLEDFDGFTPGAIWEDIKVDLEYKDDYGKTAIVGDTKYEEWGAKLANLFFDAEIRFFDEEDRVQAWRWVNN